MPITMAYTLRQGVELPESYWVPRGIVTDFIRETWSASYECYRDQVAYEAGLPPFADAAVDFSATPEEYAEFFAKGILDVAGNDSQTQTHAWAVTQPFFEGSAEAIEAKAAAVKVEAGSITEPIAGL